MKQSLRTGLFFILFLGILTSCGITQELDQSIETTSSIKDYLKQDKNEIIDIVALVERMEANYESDLVTHQNKILWEDETSALYKNYTKRDKLVKQISEDKENILSYKKELERILAKRAVDVDNKTLSLIKSSLDIIIGNMDSLETYMKASMSEEEQLYSEDITNYSESQLSLISRTNGSIILMAEETNSNIDYTINLIETYQKNAPSSY